MKSLRAQQKLKVEELKKKTAYYTTKSILERYDPAAAEKAKQQQQAALQQQQARTTARPVSDQQVRMRQPQNRAGMIFDAKLKKKYIDLTPVVIGQAPQQQPISAQEPNNPVIQGQNLPQGQVNGW